MNTEALLKFIKEMREKGLKDGQLTKLLEHSEEMLNLLVTIENSSRDDFIKIAKKKLPFVGKALSEEYNKVLAELKVTPEQLKAVSQNPKNFTPAQWKEMEQLRAEMGMEEKPEEASSNQKSKKLNKKPRLRV